MSFVLKTSQEIAKETALKVKALRLEKNLSQQGLADRAGVNISSLRRFERTGLIAFDSLLKIANAMGRLDNFENVFSASSKPKTLFVEEKAPKTRKRGTRK